MCYCTQDPPHVELEAPDAQGVQALVQGFQEGADHRDHLTEVYSKRTKRTNYFGTNLRNAGGAMAELLGGLPEHLPIIVSSS